MQGIRILLLSKKKKAFFSGAGVEGSESTKRGNTAGLPRTNAHGKKGTMWGEFPEFLTGFPGRISRAMGFSRISIYVILF